MQFDKIKFDGETVELEYRAEIPEGGKRDVRDHGTDPAPAFKAALQAFASYVTWIHSWPADTVERLDVRSVAIKRPEGEPRGINVMAVLKCARARNSTSTINTPYLTEPPKDYNGDRKGFLAESTVQLIDELEARATDYQNGERSQLKMDLKDSANTSDFDQRAAAAESATTRKPRGKKNPTAIPGVGDIANPDATEPLDDMALRQLLGSIGLDVPVDAVARWIGSERHAVTAFALAKQKAIVGQLSDEDVPPVPEILLKDATQPLSADDAWLKEPLRTAPLDVVKDADTKGEPAAAD